MTQRYIVHICLSIFLLGTSLLEISAKSPDIACSLTGSNPVTQYNTATYTLSGGSCAAATNWTVSCGSIVVGSMTSTSVQVYFTTACSSLIKALNSSGGTIASLTVTVNAGAALNGGTISNSSQTINYNTAPASLSTSSASSGTCESYLYQWYNSLNNSTYNAISGATGQNYQPPSLTVTTYYRRGVTCGLQTANSNVATVTVYPQLVSGTPSPASQSINYNTAPSALSITSGTGGSGSYSYQWQSSSASNGTYSTISGATSTSYSPGALTSATYYNVVTTSNGASVTSGYITVSVYPPIVAGSANPSSIGVNYNTSPGQLYVSGTSGGNGSYSYQWQSSPDTGFGSPTNVGTGATYTPPNLTATTYYRVGVTSNGVTAYTSMATVTVYPAVQPGSISQPYANILYNTSAGTLNDDSASGGNGSYSYQWQSSSDGSNWNNISGGTSNYYVPGNLTATTYYRLTVTSNGLSATTASIVIYVLQPGAVSPSASSINYNTSPGALTSTGVSGGNGGFSYQWQSAPTSSFASPTNVGINATTYTPPALTSTTYYRVAVTSNGFTGYSAISTITVYPAIVAGSISPSTQSINYNTTPSLFTLSGVSGGNGSYSYQWYTCATINGTYSPVSGATGTTYLIDVGITSNIYCQVAVTSNGASVTTSPATVIVYPQLVPGSVSPASISINYSTSPGQLSLTGVSGGNGTYSYQWQSSTNSGFTSPTSVGTGITTFTPSNLTASIYYRVVVTSNGVVLPSAATLVTVYPQLVSGSISPTTQTINYSAAITTLSLTGTTGGSGTNTYQWQSSTNSSFTSPVNVGTSTTTYVPSNTTSGYYRVIVTSNGAQATSNTSQVTVYPQLVAGVLSPAAQGIYSGTPTTTINLSGVSGGNGSYSYQWQSSPNSSFTSPTNFGTSTTTSVTPPNSTIYYRVIVTSNGVNATTATASVVIYPVPVITALQTVIIMGSSVMMDAGAGFTTYTWKNSAGVTKATTQQYTTNIADLYTVTVTTTGATGSYTSTPYILHDQFYNQNLNYIIANAMLVATSDTSKVRLLPVDSVHQTVQYYDGLGRGFQTDVTQGSPAKNDIVKAVAFDAYGRQNKSYLPFTIGNNGWFKVDPLGVTSGNYINSTQYAAYNSGTLDKIAHDARPFSETILESSELNRPLQSYGPGNSWGPAGNNKYVTHKYLVNDAPSEQIIAWSVTTGLPFRSPNSTGVSGGYYTTGQLTIKSTTDENGFEVREYVDKLGHTILKKVQVAGAGLTNINSWALTYYVYDKLGLLRFVLQPELSRKYATAGAPTTADMNLLGFQYQYDGRNRMTQKRVPGSGWVYMVYDKRDRLVMTQDSVQRPNKQWLVTKYDSLNRPVITAIYTHTAVVSQSGMTGLIGKGRMCEYYIGASASANQGYSIGVFPTTSLTFLTTTYYDNYTFIADLTLGGTYNYLPTEIGADNLNGIPAQAMTSNTSVTGHPTGGQVNVLGTATYLRSAMYYDAYFRTIQTIADNYKGGNDRVTNVVDFSGRVLKTRTTHATTAHAGQTVVRRPVYDHGSRVKSSFHEVGEAVVWTALVGVTVNGNVLTKNTGTNAWGDAGAFSQNFIPANLDGWVEFKVAEATNYKILGLSATNPNASYSMDYGLYPAGNTLQVREGGVDKGIGVTCTAQDVFRVERKAGVVTYKRNGILVYTSLTHSTAALYADCSIYSAATSLVDARIGTGSEVQLVANNYNEIGQLVEKNLYSTNGGATVKQSVDYRYNIRGWLQTMNNSQLTPDGVSNDDNNDLFGMELAYNAPFTIGTTPSNVAIQYNGNISAMKWSQNLALGTVKDVAYSYKYDTLNRIKSANYFINNGTWNNAISEYNEYGYSYDFNGNILKLGRRGPSGATMDSLTYNYGTAGNQLQYVSDTGDLTKGFSDGNTSGNDYAYDGNGNMVTDKNKGLTATNAIQYNYLNLPRKVIKSTGDSIVYTYDAIGRKLSQVVNLTGKPYHKKTEYDGEFIYQGNGTTDTLQFISHEEGRVVIKAGMQPEYQYHLKDHLGNVRLTFTTLTPKQTFTAGFETANQTAEAANFQNYPAGAHINTVATNAHTGSNSLYLNGAASGGQIGLAKSFSVMPGDSVTLKAYIKYNTPTTNSADLSAFAATLLSAFGLTTPVQGETGTARSAINAFGTIEGTFLDSTSADHSDLRLFVTILIFDRNYNYKGVVYQRATSSNSLLSATFVAKQPGYAYAYVSNEQTVQTDVYFDDITMTFTPSAVVQTDDYYPFGLTFSSYQRENSVPNNFKYNGKEQINDLAIDWIDYGARKFMPEIGRWGGQDPLTEKYSGLSPYSAMADNPIYFTDNHGRDLIVCGDAKSQDEYARMLSKTTGYLVSIDHGTGKVSIGAAIEGKEKTSSLLFNVVDKVVKSNYSYQIQLTGSQGDDHNVFIDSHQLAMIDISDLKKIEKKTDNAFVAGVLGHFLEEIYNTENYGDESSRAAKFQNAHNKALDTEGAIVGGMLGTGTGARVTIPEQVTIESKSQIFNYIYGSQGSQGVVNYLLEQGVTGVTVSTEKVVIGGVEVNVNVYSATTNGELKRAGKGSN